MVVGRRSSEREFGSGLRGFVVVVVEVVEVVGREVEGFWSRGLVLGEEGEGLPASRVDMKSSMEEEEVCESDLKGRF